MDNMLYIHSLRDLTQKTADIESTPIVRVIKDKFKLPIAEEKLKEHFSYLFVSDEDKQAIKNALDLIEQTMQEIVKLALTKDSDFELISLQRAYNILKAMPGNLAKDLEFTEEISSWQNQFALEAVDVLNNLSSLKSKEEKISYNKKLNEFFVKILRSNEFRFNCQDIINEVQLEAIKSLSEGMSEGFFLHRTLEEHMNNLKVERVRVRISADKLAAVDNIASNMEQIRRGIETAYKINMNMINWSILLYAYIRWLRN